MRQVAAGIITHHNTVLACQRPATGAHPGKWEFPGGKREEAETLAACLPRELKEELGIDAHVGPELWRIRHGYAGCDPIELVFFLVSSYEGSIVNHVFAETRWVAIGTLSSLDFLDGDRAVVAHLDRGTLRLETARP